MGEGGARVRPAGIRDNLMKRFIALALAACFAAPLAFADELNITPAKWTGVYAPGETVGWTLKAAPGAATTYTYTVRSNGAVEIGKGTLDLSKGSAEIAVRLDHPGAVYVTVDRVDSNALAPDEASRINTALKALVTKKDPGLTAILEQHPGLCLISEPCAVPAAPAYLPPIKAHTAILGALVSPAKIAPSAPRPADFDAFWAGKLKALAKVPVNPVLTEIAAPMPGIKLYKVKLDSLNSHVQGYLAVPAGKGPFPAMVQYQWAGVYALIPWNCANRAAQGWLCFNVSSHDMAPDQASGAPTNYFEVGNSDREASYFLNMYLRDTRALDWVRTLPQWNKKTLVLNGASMGGQQSLVTAGLNPGKYTAVVVNQPAGGDSHATLNGRMQAFPNWAVSNPAVAATAPYFDTVNFASKITAPTLISVGLIDSVCPPTSILSAANQIPVPHEIVPMIESEHGNYTPDKQGPYLERAEDVLATLRFGGRFVPNETVSKAP